MIRNELLKYKIKIEELIMRFHIFYIGFKRIQHFMRKNTISRFGYLHSILVE